MYKATSIGAGVVQGMGMILESLRQPVINGYLIAGSIVGPGGLQLIKVDKFPVVACQLCRVFSNAVYPRA